MKVLLATMALLSCSNAWAQQPQCGPRDLNFSNFKDIYGESLVVSVPIEKAQGEPAGANVEILASRKGTWTLFVTDITTGVACIFASGTGWVRPTAPEPAGKDS